MNRLVHQEKNPREYAQQKNRSSFGPGYPGTKEDLSISGFDGFCLLQRAASPLSG